MRAGRTDAMGYRGAGTAGAGLLVAALLMTGCGASSSAASAGTSTAGSSTAGSSSAAQDTDRAPATAQLVCSDEIRDEVVAALALGSIPDPGSTWVAPVYTCTYAPPMGPLVLSVTVADDGDAAHAVLDGLRTELGAADPEPGLGEEAYSTATGTVIAVKDDMVLQVDATALPDDLGLVHETRTDLARVLAAGVFDCWAEQD